MDNEALRQRLLDGARTLGVTPSEQAAGQLLRYAQELLRWNARVNLTAITDPEEVVEKHLLDSLAIGPEVVAGTGTGPKRLLDIGTGAGLPGLPLKVAHPSLAVTLVDAVAKKIGFVKAAAAGLGLAGVTALHARLAGQPEKEGVPRAEVVVSRAFAELDAFLPLAKAYLELGGPAKVVAMLGKASPDPEGAASRAGLRLSGLRRYLLPFSGAERHVAVFQP